MVPSSVDLASFTPAAQLPFPSSYLLASSKPADNFASPSGSFSANFRDVMSSYQGSEHNSDAKGQSSTAPAIEGNAVSETRQEKSISEKPGSETKNSSEQADSGNSQSAVGADSPVLLNAPGTGFSTLQMTMQGGRPIPLTTPSPETVDGVNSAGVAKAEPNGNGGVINATTGQTAILSSLALAQDPRKTGPASKGKSDATKRSENTPLRNEPGTMGNEVPIASSNIVLKLGQAENYVVERASNTQGTLNKSGIYLNTASIQGLTESEALKKFLGQPNANNFAFAVRLSGKVAQSTTGHSETIQAGEGQPLDVLNAQQKLAVAATGAIAPLGGKPSSERLGQEEQSSLTGLLPTSASGGDLPRQGLSSDPGKTIPDVSTAEPDSSESRLTEQTEPVRNVNLQLTADNNQRVDIRLVEVAGEMRVSVRAGDTKLAETLQSHIPDLAKGLSQQSVQAEIWSPRANNTSQENGSNSGAQTSSRGNDASNQGGQQQRQGNNGQQKNQPGWVDELEKQSVKTR